MSFAESLDLSRNDFRGTLTNELSPLKNLTQIILRENEIEGNFMDVIDGLLESTQIREFLSMNGPAEEYHMLTSR